MELFEKISSLAKRRGFIYPGSEIYGGLGGFYDFGPLGVELKNNIKKAWWEAMVKSRDDVVGLDSAIIMNPKIWEASGHVWGFSDVLVVCENCGDRRRVDEYPDITIENIEKTPGFSDKSYLMVYEGKKDIVCKKCGAKDKIHVSKFNLMFKTFVGASGDSASVAYLRPETAGGIFMNFKNVSDTMRVKIPFGIAQIGKAFRNEINPKDFIFRTREFEQMELEYFVEPKEADKAFKNWIKERINWYKEIGLKNIREKEQKPEERAHYSKGTVDIEYKFPFGWQEIEGIANRGDFDLSSHAKASKNDLNYFNEETKEKFIPYVIEPSAGVERIMFALFCESYAEEDKRVILKFQPKLAPYKVAVFPLLSNKPQLVELAKSIYHDLKKNWMVAWDDRGNIGKRYYAQDEIGTPYCITVDFDSLDKKDVTVRDRDSMKQERIKISELKDYFSEKLS